MNNLLDAVHNLCGVDVITTMKLGTNSDSRSFSFKRCFSNPQTRGVWKTIYTCHLFNQIKNILKHIWDVKSLSSDLVKDPLGDPHLSPIRQPWFQIARAQELARLQGIGTTDWVHYNMSEVGEATMRSFIGNSFPGFNLLGVDQSWTLGTW